MECWHRKNQRTVYKGGWGVLQAARPRIAASLARLATHGARLVFLVAAGRE
jgi:hypothetical protein